MSQSTSGTRSLTTENHHSAYDAANSRLILAETASLIQAIGLASHHLAVIGGLVPGILVPVIDPDLPDHVGTQDIDLCLSIALTEGKVGNYDRIERCLKEANFEMARHRGGGRVRLPLRVTGPAAYFAAKSDAINRRDKGKDAYDLIWLIQAWAGGTKALACEVQSSAISDRPEFQRAIDDLGNQFSDIDAIGARRYARFLASDERDLDADAQIAVGAMQEFLTALQV